MRGNPLLCFYGRRLICIWWHPCWLPENVSVLPKSSLTQFLFFLFSSWKHIANLFWLEIIIFIFISSSLMYAIVSRTCLTIGITSSGWKMEILRLFLWNSDPLGLTCSPKPVFLQMPQVDLIIQQILDSLEYDFESCPFLLPSTLWCVISVHLGVEEWNAAK